MTPAPVYSLLLVICRHSLDSFRPRENMLCYSAEQMSTGLKGYELYSRQRLLGHCKQQAVKSCPETHGIGMLLLRPGRCFRAESQNSKKKTKRCFSIQNLGGFIIFGVLGQMDRLNQ